MGLFLRVVAKAIIMVAVVTPTVAQASDNPLPDRMAIITIKGLETTNLDGRDWFVHLSAGDSEHPTNQVIDSTTYPKYPNDAHIEPGILTKITDHISNTDEFSFYLNNASSCHTVPDLHIVYGYAPTGLCCVTDDNGTISYANMTQFECVTKENNCFSPPAAVVGRTWQAGLACTGMIFQEGDCGCSTLGVCCNATTGDCVSVTKSQVDCIEEGHVWYGYPPGTGPNDCDNSGFCTHPLPATNCTPASDYRPTIPITAFPPAWNIGVTTGPDQIWPASDMWWIRAEFAFCSESPSPTQTIDISYVDSFSHPLSVNVYGSNQAPTFTDTPTGTLAPACTVKQTIINSLWNDDGFKTADGQHHSGAEGSPVDNSACTYPPVWICSGGIDNCKNTGPILWQNPSPNSDSDWNPRDHHGDFMRVMTPDSLYNRWITEDTNCGSVFSTNPNVGVLPGYEDAMERLYSMCPVIEGDGSGPVIFIGGNVAALCNAQNFYSTNHDHSFCEGSSPVDCSANYHAYPNTHSADFYGTWARVGRTESCLDCLTGEYAYWFELYKHNPNATSQMSFLLDDSGAYWNPNEKLKIPSNGSSSGSVDEINACLYARLAAANIGWHGKHLPAMSWGGEGGDAYDVAKTYLGAVVRDIAATLGHGQLGANAGIGYAFTLETGHESNDGFFWLKGNQMVGPGNPAYSPWAVPNEHGRPTDHWFDDITWYSYSTKCCCASLPGGQWNESDLFGDSIYKSFTGHPTDLATGQMAFLNNWFSDLALGACCIKSTCSQMTEAKCKELNGTFYGYNTTCPGSGCPTTPDHTMKPWSQTYKAMYDELGVEVYCSSFDDFWKRSDGKGPQIPSNNYKYMKYEFELGTMTLGDITDHSGLGTHGDRKVDVADLLHMLAAWGPEGITDLNGDHIVNRDDLIVLLNNWAP